MADLPNQNAVAEGTLSALQKASMQNFGDIKQPNFYGLPDAPRQWNDALQDITEKLESRYSKPNWFDIAAGFAKPQLGGFMASLGSANEAMAKNVEQQRAQEMPIAQVRLMMAQNAIQQQHREAAGEIYNKALAESKRTGQPISDTDYGNIVAHVTENDPIAQAAKVRSATYIANQTNTRSNATTSSQLQQDVANYPGISINEGQFKFGPQTEDDRNKYEATKMSAFHSMNTGMSDGEFKSMGDTEQRILIANYMKQRKDNQLGFVQATKNDANKAQAIIPLIATIRSEASDPEMAPIFSLFNKGDFSSKVKQFLDQFGGVAGSAANGMAAAAMSEFKNMTGKEPNPELRAKIDSMSKNLVRLEIESRGLAINATDKFTDLNHEGSPNLGNSQLGFISILDQLGLSHAHKIKQYKYINDEGVNEQTLPLDPVYGRLNQEYSRYARNLGNSTPDLSKTPDYLDNPLKFKYPDLSSEEADARKARTSTGSESGKPSEKGNTRDMGGKTYYRQPNGSWSVYPKGKP